MSREYRRVTLFIFLFALMLGFGSHAQAQTVTVEYWNLLSGADGRWMADLVDQFNAEHDHIQVNMQVLPWGEPYYSRLSTSILVGNAPDVAIAHDWALPRYASRGDLYEITDRFLSTGGIHQDDYLELPWQAAVYEGRQYGIPLDAHPYALFYNRDMFSDAGLDPDSPPTTADEFVAAARALTRDTDGDGRPDQWGVLPTTDRRVWHSILYQLGGQLLSDDLTQAAFREEGTRALEMIVDIFTDPTVAAPDVGDANIAFRTGQVGMFINGPWNITAFEEQEGLNFSVAEFPVFGNEPAVWTASHLMIFPRQRNLNPDKLEAAQVFVRWLTANSLPWAMAGQVPAQVTVIGSDDFRSLEHQPVFARQLGYVAYKPGVRRIVELLEPLDEMMEAAVLGHSTPAEAVDQAITRINRILSR